MDHRRDKKVVGVFVRFRAPLQPRGVASWNHPLLLSEVRVMSTINFRSEERM
jgi:hypothetical protein